MKRVLPLLILLVLSLGVFGLVGVNSHKKTCGVSLEDACGCGCAVGGSDCSCGCNCSDCTLGDALIKCTQCCVGAWKATPCTPENN